MNLEKSKSINKMDWQIINGLLITLLTIFNLIVASTSHSLNIIEKWKKKKSLKKDVNTENEVSEENADFKKTSFSRPIILMIITLIGYTLMFIFVELNKVFVLGIAIINVAFVLAIVWILTIHNINIATKEFTKAGKEIEEMFKIEPEKK